MKIVTILMLLICFVMMTFPALSGNDLGDKIVGKDGIIFGTLNTISNVSKFFSQVVQKTLGIVTDIGVTASNGWTVFVNWLKGIFK